MVIQLGQVITGIKTMAPELLQEDITMKKLLSVILALVLVLGLAVVPAFADETTAPTSSTTATHPGITSVTVEGTTAYYQYDNNTGSDVVYIRAKLPNTSTWGDLQSATVVITVTGGNLTVADGNTTFTPIQNGNAYTYTLDLLNKRYSVSVTDSGNTYTYYLAAGFTNKVVIGSGDNLGIANATIGNSSTSGSSATLNIYGSVVQNNYMGNTYYVNHNTNWTDTNVTYYIAGTYSLGEGTLTSVNKTLSFCSGASLTSGGCLNNDGTLDLSGNMPYINVTNGNTTRKYYISAVVNPTTTFVVTSSTYRIDFTELENSDYGPEFDNNIFYINSALTAYYGTSPVFSTSASVMDVMLDFIHFATQEHNYLTSGDTYCSDTYLSTLNGIGEFSAGDNSGWMFMDGAYTSSCTVPSVGAADYALGDASQFTWFLTTNYMAHISGWD